MTVSKKGWELAAKLPTINELSSSDHMLLVESCSKICKLAATLERINTWRLSIEADAKETTRRNNQETMCRRNIEKHLLTVSRIAKIEVGSCYNGDTRGAAVKLTLPAPYQHKYDCFGKEGVCVP